MDIGCGNGMMLIELVSIPAILFAVSFLNLVQQIIISIYLLCIIIIINSRVLVSNVAILWIIVFACNWSRHISVSSVHSNNLLQRGSNASDCFLISVVYFPPLIKNFSIIIQTTEQMFKIRLYTMFFPIVFTSNSSVQNLKTR